MLPVPLNTHRGVRELGGPGASIIRVMAFGGGGKLGSPYLWKLPDVEGAYYRLYMICNVLHITSMLIHCNLQG